MKRFLSAGVLALSLCAARAAATQQPTFRAGSDAVRVFVTVTDRDGRLVWQTKVGAGSALGGIE